MSDLSNLRQTLSQLTTTYLAPEINFMALKQLTDHFFNLLVDITGLEEAKNAHRDSLMLPGGKCIGSFWAGYSLMELMRTRQFVRGLYSGILSAREKFPNTRIHVLYAGTGPFATLALPITEIFSPQEIQFTLLEIQPESASMLQKVIEALQLGSFIHNVVVADATTYRIDPEHPVHVLVSETMQHSLKKEPQVAITLNLAPQLLPGGILIPEKIDVWVGLMDPKRSMAKIFQAVSVEEENQIWLGKIFTLDQRTATIVSKNGLFPPVEVAVDPDLYTEFPICALFTEIQVCGDEIIRQDACSLTLPDMLFDTHQKASAPENMIFQYEMGHEPGFRISL